jgi:hypothetical protein
MLTWNQIVERGKQHNKTVICEVEKKNGHKYFKIKCDICGDESFSRTDKISSCIKCHLELYGRSSLGGIKRLCKNEFLKRSQEKHGNKYDYNLVQYKNSKSKVRVFCKECKIFFDQEAKSHMNGSGCKFCAFKNQTFDIDEFIYKCKQIHGDKYNYDLIEYKNSRNKIKIFCNECRLFFFQRPMDHLRGNKCNLCYFKNKTSCSNDFKSKAKQIHGDKYNYDFVNYINAKTKVKIKCKKCHSIFEQLPYIHLRNHGCSKCNESKGENRVAKYLSENNIRYIKNKIFKTLRYKSYLKPDFYLYDLDLIIEYDGEFHYKALIGSTPQKKQKNLEDTQCRDKIKNEWAKANNIPLLRIPYWDFDRIEELIEAFILQHTKKKEIKQLVLEM